MKYSVKAPSNKGVHGIEQRNGAVNGLISSSIRLSAFLWYAAGGSPYDIGLSHGIGVKDVYNSVWRCVDAINATKQLDIKFPSKQQQKELAGIAERKSKAGLNGVVGFIDGMLVWIQKPTKKECKKAKFGPVKFYCGQKKKMA